jgi:hypothetical protein
MAMQVPVAVKPGGQPSWAAVLACCIPLLIAALRDYGILGVAAVQCTVIK